MRKDSSIGRTRVYIIKAPLIYPFRTALGQHDHLENIIVELELGDGTKGFGEAAVATHITGETVAETLENLTRAARDMHGKDARGYPGLSCWLHERLSGNRSAIAALEVALADALCKQRKMPLWKFFGKSVRRISSDITIVISSLEETEKAVRTFSGQGFSTFKVKVGRDRELDHQRIMMVKKCAPRARIYIDANQGYTAQETLSFLRALKRAGVVPALVEQPVPKADFEGLRRVSRLAGTLVCADESASSVEDVRRIIRHKAAGAINIKLMKFGLFRAHEAYLLARKHGIRLMMGGMMETSLSMTAAAHFAAGAGGVDFADLDCPFFIKKDREKNPYLSPRGVYDLRKSAPGIGINPSRRT